MTHYHSHVRPLAAAILLGSALITTGTGCFQQSSTPESASLSTPIRAAEFASAGSPFTGLMAFAVPVSSLLQTRPHPGGTQRATTLAVPVGSPGSEAEAVRQTLTKMQTARNITEMADYVSNDTAGVMGIVMTIPIAMAISMQDMAGSMQDTVGHSLGGNSGAPPPKIDTTLKTDLERILKKYGMDAKASATPEEAQAKLAGRGREFLKEIGGLMDRMDRMKPNGKQKNPNGRDNALKISVGPNQVDYKVVSPREVTLIPKPGVNFFGKGTMKNGKQVPLKAIVEDGHWRLHMGGFKDLDAMMGGGTAPGGRPIPPGGIAMPPKKPGK